MGDNLSPTVWFLIKTLASCTAISAISLSSACKQFYTPTESMHIYILEAHAVVYNRVDHVLFSFSWESQNLVVRISYCSVAISYFSVICCSDQLVSYCSFICSYYRLLFCNLLFESVFFCSLLFQSVILL